MSYHDVTNIVSCCFPMSIIEYAIIIKLFYISLSQNILPAYKMFIFNLNKQQYINYITYSTADRMYASGKY